MAASDNLITISEIVNGLMFKSKLPDGEEIRIKQLVLDGYRELNLTTLPYGRAQYLGDMNENYVLDMPVDLDSVKDIFVPANNSMWSLTRREDIPRILTESGDIPEGWGDGDNIRDDGIYYGSRGGVNTEGYYIEDYVNRRIIFRNIERSEVLLDYNTSGITKDGTTYIPASVKGALEAYVMMMLAFYEIKSPRLHALYEKEFNKQKGILRMKDFNYTEFIDGVYNTITASIKR